MENDKNLYELGYLLIPVIAAEKLSEEVGAIRAVIESNNGVISNEEQPKVRKLAYEIAHNIAGSKRVRYEDAYFGWMKFNLSPELLEKVVEGLKKSSTLLRHLIINLSKDSGSTLKNDTNKAQVIKKTKKVASEKEIDKEIDNLLTKEENA
ncbi:MAG: 30S ribosomal protein S6 [bacterium]